EAVVAKWLKQVGEAVAADEPVAELETDKITVQLPAPSAGVLSERRAAVGATVKVGDVIGQVDASKAGKPAPAPAPAPVPKPEAKPAPRSAPAPAAPAGLQVGATAGGNGESVDKDALLKLTPSQRASAREA